MGLHTSELVFEERGCRGHTYQVANGRGTVFILTLQMSLFKSFVNASFSDAAITEIALCNLDVSKGLSLYSNQLRNIGTIPRCRVGLFMLYITILSCRMR